MDRGHYGVIDHHIANYPGDWVVRRRTLFFAAFAASTISLGGGALAQSYAGAIGGGGGGGGSSSLVIGSTPITGGATTQVLFNLAGTVTSDTGFTYAGAGGATALTGTFSAGTSTSTASISVTSVNLGFADSSHSIFGDVFLQAGGWSNRLDNYFGWTAGNPGTNDTVLCRDSAGVVGFGTSSCNDAGTVNAAAYKVGGAAGATCTLTTIAHLTVVAGIVTLCN